MSTVIAEPYVLVFQKSHSENTGYHLYMETRKLTSNAIKCHESTLILTLKLSEFRTSCLSGAAVFELRNQRRVLSMKRAKSLMTSDLRGRWARTHLWSQAHSATLGTVILNIIFDSTGCCSCQSFFFFFFLKLNMDANALLYYLLGHNKKHLHYMNNESNFVNLTISSRTKEWFAFRH